MTVSIPFSGMVTHDGTITYTHYDGRMYSVLPSNYAYTGVMEAFKRVAENPDDIALRDKLHEISQPKTLIRRSSGGRVKIEDGQVFYDDKPIQNFLAERILWMASEGFDARPMMAFLEKVKENPSNRAVEELYRFMEANRMGITPDGMILAYKRVSHTYRDIYTGKISNRVGDTPEMARNEVNDNPTITCSHGLHVCAMSYLPSYASSPNNRVVICSIHPRDVVSVPIEYHNAKMRVCRYSVIGEIEDDLDDILGRTPVWDENQTDEWQDWFDDEPEAAYAEADAAYAEPDDEEEHNAAYTEADKRTLGAISEFVVEVFGKHFECYTELSDENLRDLGADELDLVEIIMDIEDYYEIEVRDSEITLELSGENVRDLIVTRLKGVS